MNTFQNNTQERREDQYLDGKTSERLNLYSSNMFLQLTLKMFFPILDLLHHEYACNVKNSLHVFPYYYPMMLLGLSGFQITTNPH